MLVSFVRGLVLQHSLLFWLRMSGQQAGEPIVAHLVAPYFRMYSSNQQGCAQREWHLLKSRACHVGMLSALQAQP